MGTYAENRPKQEKLAENLMHVDEPGMTLRKAFTDAGYSKNVADQGWAAVPNKVVRLLAKKGIRLMELGKISAEQQEQMVRGRLVYNTLKGSDKGVLSAKALGSDRRVNMFTAESQTGIVVIGQAPIAITADLLKPPED